MVSMSIAELKLDGSSLQLFFLFLNGKYGRNSHVKHSQCYMAVPGT
jgi:hypothetical protein